MEGEKNMNILVIGNGFDLEHNLPTKYWDFIMFIKNGIIIIIKNTIVIIIFFTFSDIFPPF